MIIISKRLGSTAEQYVDSIDIDSYFVCTADDIEDAKKMSRRNLFFAVKSTFSFIFSVLANVMAGFILNFFMK